jgi:hypothetical protein
VKFRRGADKDRGLTRTPLEMKRATVEVQLCQDTLREFLTLCAATGHQNNRCLKILKKSRTKDRVTVRLSLSRHLLLRLFRLAAAHNMTMDQYLEQFLTSSALPTLEELERIESKEKIVRFKSSIN